MEFLPGATVDDMHILTINMGSSSLRAGIYSHDDGITRDLDVQVERIGSGTGRIRIADADGRDLLDRTATLSDHTAALTEVLAWLRERGSLDALTAIGHRIVHGGRDYSEPMLVTDKLIQALRLLVPIDPEHLPQAIRSIETLQQTFPTVPQVACFDTAFHRHMPVVAQSYPLPQRFEEMGILRYGFHGLSYEFILGALRMLEAGAPEPGVNAARGRIVIAHLGNGASMAAVRDGVGIDTTMGFSPTGGLMMGTRTGDLDPGVFLYLLQSRGMTEEEINRLLNKQAGLLGVSGTSADMRELLESEARNPQTETGGTSAALAIELFCYTAKKHLGALIAVLGGIDTLVFTGGIGEHAAPIRARICRGLEFLGIALDPALNEIAAPIISHPGAPVTVRIIPTDEDEIIARHTAEVVHGTGDSHVHV